ncbi:MAG: class I SAM-dependent rRNA methyltransferase, partial [Chlamydiia bacterium]|nr:class I SAM-dependent rRNA methyltransferase [Chlamydiia bacterium]
MNKAILKPGREASLKNGHPWIFSGALRSLPSIEPGEILPVESARGDHLGYAYFHPKQSLAGRMLTFDARDPLDAVVQSLRRAVEFRRTTILSEITNACRLVNAEADNLPGLIVDQYADVLVLQIGTWGMERLRPTILKFLADEVRPRAILEISQSGSRLSEGLQPVREPLLGEVPEEIECLEEGVRFIVPLEKGQKTGFFLDQRENRAQLRRLSRGKRVLNCFSYTGGFSLHALAGGAKEVVSVDVSQPALDFIPRQLALNGLDQNFSRAVCEDAFRFLEEQSLEYEIVVLDPPAFAKKKKDLPNAINGYRNLNRTALAKMPQNTLLLTCSCSYFVPRESFELMLKQA